MKKILLASMFFVGVIVFFSLEALCENLPEGWNKYETTVGTYDVGVDKDTFKSQPFSYYIKSKKEVTVKEYGIIFQTISTEKYKGKRVHFSAFVKGKDIQGTGFFFADLRGLIGNSEPFKVAEEWQKISLIFYVPKESTTINFGLSLYGTGHVWTDDINIETVKADNIFNSQEKAVLNDPINLP